MSKQDDFSKLLDEILEEIIRMDASGKNIWHSPDNEKCGLSAEKSQGPNWWAARSDRSDRRENHKNWKNAKDFHPRAERFRDICRSIGEHSDKKEYPHQGRGSGKNEENDVPLTIPFYYHRLGPKKTSQKLRANLFLRYLSLSFINPFLGTLPSPRGLMLTSLPKYIAFPLGLHYILIEKIPWKESKWGTLKIRNIDWVQKQSPW